MNPFTSIEKILKQASFNKKGVTWHKRLNNDLVWIINFQKGKGATKEAFSLTINIGMYAEGTFELMFGKKLEAYWEPDSFFRERPKFFGSSTEWWNFNNNGSDGNEKNLKEIESLFVSKILPFLEMHNTFSSVLPYLPVEKWKSNTNFHGELLRLAVACFLFKDNTNVRILLQRIIDGKTGWDAIAKAILEKTTQNEANI